MRSECVQKGRMLAYVSPYLIEIVEEGWLWLDATSEPQGPGGPISSNDSANYRDKDTKQSFAETSSTFGIIFDNDFYRNVLIQRDIDYLQ